MWVFFLSFFFFGGGGCFICNLFISTLFYTKHDSSVEIFLFLASADRSVGQLLKEMDEITERQQAIIAEEKDVKLMSDYRSPRSPRSPGNGVIIMATTLCSFEFRVHVCPFFSCL